MDESVKHIIKKSLDTITTLKSQLAELEQGKNTKIAVIGMGCNFPGGCNTPEKFWSAIRDGNDGIVEIPKERWDINKYYCAEHGVPGKIYVRKGGFLQSDISCFSSSFFKISPVEAKMMDPQQRQLLEVTWNSIENAGYDPETLKGSKTGVYIGISSNGEFGKAVEGNAEINQYIGTGTSSSVASGRIAYYFGLNGPAVSIDTACSSSLVSTYLAVKALQNGDCNMALAGGVNIMLSPEVMSSLCMMNALSEDGKTRPFDSNSDGYGRGEGCGVIVLKRLSDAIRDNDNIYAVIDGGAMNNDGRSSGLTVPNGKAQKEVMATALHNAGMTPDDIGYIETHGTGTPLGDPIEINSINEVYGNRNVPESLAIGAVKGNIGHLESAAGIASLIKTILCIYHKTIPKIANLGVLNERIKKDVVPLCFPQNTYKWKIGPNKSRAAGVSSFGFSGTNVHIILSEAPEKERNQNRLAETNRILSLSAKDEDTLIRKMEQYKDFIEKSNLDIADICATTNVGRADYMHRAVLIGKTREDFIDKLGKLLEEKKNTGTIYSNETTLCGSRLGEDRWGARRTLYDEKLESTVYTCKNGDDIEPKFAFLIRNLSSVELDNAFELYHAHEVFASEFDRCLGLFETYLDTSFGGINAILDDKSEKNRAYYVFSALYALIRFLESMRIKPEILYADQIGICLAAAAAEMISMEDSVAVYSLWAEGNEGELERKLSECHFSKPKYRYFSVSSMSSLRSEEEVRDELKAEKLQKTYDCELALESLYKQGYHFFIEIGGSSEYSKKKGSICERNDVSYTSLQEGSLTKQVQKCLARAICLGITVDWKNYYLGQSYQKVVLPNYPMKKEKYWVEMQKKTEYNDVLEQYGLNGRKISLPINMQVWEYTFSYSNFPELADNSGVVHIGYYIELLKRGLEYVFNGENYVISDMNFMTPLLILDSEVKKVQLIIDDRNTNNTGFRFCSRNMDQDNWNTHVYGTVLFKKGTIQEDNAPYLLNELKEEYRDDLVEREVFYRPLEKERGFYFGKTVRWVQELMQNQDGNALAFFRERNEDEPVDEYCLGYHPGILDSCAQICNYLPIEKTSEGQKYMVHCIENLELIPCEPTDTVYAKLTLLEYDSSNETISCSFEVIDEIGRVVLRVGKITLKEFDEAAIGKMKELMDASISSNERDKSFLRLFLNTKMENRQRLLTEYITKIFASEIEEDDQKIDPNVSVFDYGMDSMIGIRFYNEIEEKVGVNLQFQDLVQCETLNNIAARVLKYLPGMTSDDEEKTEYKPDKTGPELWIRNYKPGRKPKIRIFCFPSGFKSADMFDDWQEILGDDIEICGVRIPGLDSERIHEKTPVDIDQFIEEMESQIGELLKDGVPCTSIGHSWGALFAYRMAYRMLLRPEVPYVKLFVSGFTAANHKNSSIKKVLDVLKDCGFYRIPLYDEIKDDKAALEVVSKAFETVWDYEEAVTKLTLPSILNACALIDHFHYKEEEKFTVPIVGLHGVDDYAVPIEEMNEWEKVTTAEFRLYTMEGDHQFIDKSQSQEHFLSVLKEELYQSIKDFIIKKK